MPNDNTIYAYTVILVSPFLLAMAAGDALIFYIGGYISYEANYENFINGIFFARNDPNY